MKVTWEAVVVVPLLLTKGEVPATEVEAARDVISELFLGPTSDEPAPLRATEELAVFSGTLASNSLSIFRIG